MFDPSAIRNRFGTFLPRLVISAATGVLLATCLVFLADLQDSHEDGISYSIHFSGTFGLAVFVAAFMLVIVASQKATSWLMRKSATDVARERRFFARVEDYNEARERVADSQRQKLR
jgi:hypothetical protein